MGSQSKSIEVVYQPSLSFNVNFFKFTKNRNKRSKAQESGSSINMKQAQATLQEKNRKTMQLSNAN